MKNVCVLFFMLWFAAVACKKDVGGLNETNELLEQDFIQQPLVIRPRLPDTLREPGIPLWPRLPRVPRGQLFSPIALQQCIYSYDELVLVLGTNKINCKGVVLY